MRIVTWNCCAGPLAAKLAAARSLRPDLLVLPEAPRVEQGPHAVWIGDNPRKGFAIIARPPWRLELLDLTPVSLPRYFLPVRVTGPETLTLWGVWAHRFGEDKYVRGTHRAIDEARGHLRKHQPLLFGDFNSHSRWDAEHPADRSHTALVEKLAALGYTSAYHHLRARPHGHESHPTFYEYRHRHRPYHLDYAFVPASWTPRLQAIRIGRHARWTQWSDHMPLAVDFTDAPA